ncbi:hypothetical protein IWX49DRAFT_637463 [Phyllosticta citricarpa]|uniref:Uncharacterized protein n=1 Tax=Phyllosticta citricarpa TaxID=55181 RepID=A0ABR1L5N8_9PEZI
MASKDSSLYGIPRPKKNSSKELSSSTNLAFASQLSSLIASSSSSTSSKDATAKPRQRPRDRDDIFTQHNRNSRKRALADISNDDNPAFAQRHSTHSEAVDEATWRRSRRKMEEKARLYAAMKRGDVEDDDERFAVDFDRKWAEAHPEGEEADTSSGDDDDDGDDDGEEEVEYEDEFGRSRKGTRAAAARAERLKMQATREPEGDAARPAMPENLIYGDTIQTAAFNLDEGLAQREFSPPPQEHFDANKEIRTKGVAFFQFSKDEEERKKQMEALDKEREETERKRTEREKKMEERKRQVEERRKALREKRTTATADRFLDGLMSEMGSLPEEKNSTNNSTKSGESKEDVVPKEDVGKNTDEASREGE